MWPLRKTKAFFQKIGPWLARSRRWGLMLILLFGLCSLGWRLVPFFTRRLLSENSFSFGWGNDRGYLGSFNWPARQLTVVSLPETLLIPAASGLGTYPLAGYGRLEEVTGRADLRKESVALAFRAPLLFWESDWVAAKYGSPKEVKKVLTAFGRRCFFSGGGESLKAADCLRVWFLAMMIRSKKVTLIDLKEEGLLEEVEFASRPASLLSADYREKGVNWWEDDAFRRNEGVYGVANATSVSGLAGVAADFIENWGGSVVKVGDWPNEVERCQLMVKPGEEKKMAYPLKRLAGFFGCEIVQSGMENYVVDVVLVVGRDFDLLVGGQAN